MTANLAPEQVRAAIDQAIGLVSDATELVERRVWDFGRFLPRGGRAPLFDLMADMDDAIEALRLERSRWVVPGELYPVTEAES